MQITGTLGDQGNVLPVAHIATVIDAPVRSARPSALPHGNGANVPARGGDRLSAGVQSAFRNLGVACRHGWPCRPVSWATHAPVGVALQRPGWRIHNLTGRPT
jgi:hypothetical protein